MIKESHKYQGSGGIYTVECDNEAELEQYLADKVKSIDFYRSPRNQGVRPLLNGGFTGSVKYYGLD